MPVLLSPLARLCFELSAKLRRPVLVKCIGLDDRCRTQITHGQLNANRLRMLIVRLRLRDERFKFFLRWQSVVAGFAKPGGVDDRRATCSRCVRLPANAAEMVER